MVNGVKNRARVYFKAKAARQQYQRIQIQEAKIMFLRNGHFVVYFKIWAKPSLFFVNFVLSSFQFQ